MPDDLDPAWTGETAVLCVAGRGPLDEAVCAMLAQVLGKRGMRARVVSAEAVVPQPDRHAGRDRRADDLRLLSSRAANSLSPLRYLIRRLRQRAPDATIMVGLWRADPALLTDERIATAVGADLYVNVAARRGRRLPRRGPAACGAPGDGGVAIPATPTLPMRVVAQHGGERGLDGLGDALLRLMRSGAAAGPAACSWSSRNCVRSTWPSRMNSCAEVHEGAPGRPAP